MNGLGRPSVRAVVYTRKSSEEGLDQEFNSLDAQYEACTAYIASQRHEGWKLVKQRFDDGDMFHAEILRLLFYNDYFIFNFGIKIQWGTKFIYVCSMLIPTCKLGLSCKSIS